MLPQHVEAERSVLKLVALHGDCDLLAELEANDFTDDKHKWLFAELRLIKEQDLPLGDTPTLTHWFLSKPAKGRAKAALNDDNTAVLTASVFSEYCTIAHRNYYLRCLRIARLERMQLFAAKQWQQKIDAGESPTEVLEWAQNVINQIWQKAYQVMPEKVAVE